MGYLQKFLILIFPRIRRRPRMSFCGECLSLASLLDSSGVRTASYPSLKSHRLPQRDAIGELRVLE